MSVNRQPVPATTPFPFDGEFQKSLLRLLMEDGSFAATISQHLEPRYFQNEVLGWVYAYGRRHQEEYQSWPSANVYKQQVMQMDPQLRALYGSVIDQVSQSSLRDELWMRDQVLDFVKRNIFYNTYQETRNLYNDGKVDQAYDQMMAAMEQISRTTWEPVDEEWFFEELPARQNERMNYDPYKDSIGTGIPALDHILSGGLSLGEMGILIAYAKCGKTTLLTNMGIAATRLNWKKTAHFVFEGRRQMVSNRYDAVFMDEWYNNIKRGELSEAKKYSEAYQLYQMLRGLLVIRGYTERWDYSVVDIHEDLKRWKRERGWIPELLIVDYGDLIGGREKHYKSETEKQQASFRDQKSLANRGYALWTASQAQRPDAGAEDRVHTIRSRQIADCYAKVRIADFIASHNATRDERKMNRSRLYAELYRENEAEQEIQLECNFAKMTVRQADAKLGEAQPASLQPIPARLTNNTQQAQVAV